MLVENACAIFRIGVVFARATSGLFPAWKCYAANCCADRIFDARSRGAQTVDIFGLTADKKGLMKGNLRSGSLEFE